MNVVSSPSFEDPLSGWTPEGSAGVTDLYGAFDGTKALFLFARRLILVPPPAFSRESQDLLVEPGEEYELDLRVNGDSAPPSPLRAILTDGPFETVYQLDAPLGPGWQLWSPGFYTPQNPTIRLTLETLVPMGQGSGFWLVDSVRFEAEIMRKRREIRAALVSTIQAAGGVAECVAGVVALEKIETYPHVQVQYGEETKSQRTLTRKDCEINFLVGVFAKDVAGEGVRADLLDEVCGAIESAVEKNDDGSGGRANLLGLGYVTEVFVDHIDPENTPELIARGIALWIINVRVEYRHDRRSP